MGTEVPVLTTIMVACLGGGGQEAMMSSRWKEEGLGVVRYAAADMMFLWSMCCGGWVGNQFFMHINDDANAF